MAEDPQDKFEAAGEKVQAFGKKVQGIGCGLTLLVTIPIVGSLIAGPVGLVVGLIIGGLGLAVLIAGSVAKK